MTHRAKKRWVIFLNGGPEHIKLTTVDICTLATHWHTCRHLYALAAYMKIDCWLYSKTCLKWPLKKEDQLSLNAGQKYCRMLQGEHSAIFFTFIKLPFVINIFVLSFFEWLLKTRLTVLTTYMNILIKVRFFTTIKDGSSGPTALESFGPYFEIMGQLPRPTINLKACTIVAYYHDSITILLSFLINDP